MGIDKTGVRSTWVPAWLCLSLMIAGPAAAQSTASDPPARAERRSLPDRMERADRDLARGLLRRAVEGYEAVVDRALEWRSRERDETRIRSLTHTIERARLQIATARIRQNEPELARRQLRAVLRDPMLTPQARQRAEAGLRAVAPAPEDPPSEESLNIDVGVALLVAFGILEAVLLAVGLSLLAAGWCEDPPTFMLSSPCDHTVRDLGIGFVIAGSVWWIAPAVVGGVLSQASRGGIGTSPPATTSLVLPMRF